MNLTLFVFSLHLQGALKNASVKLDLLTDIDMSLMEGKGIIGRICHAIYWYTEANKKYMKNYDKIKNHDISSFGKYIIYIDKQCLKRYR